jgi:hypothetical protein
MFDSSFLSGAIDLEAVKANSSQKFIGDSNGAVELFIAELNNLESKGVDCADLTWILLEYLIQLLIFFK